MNKIALILFFALMMAGLSACIQDNPDVFHKFEENGGNNNENPDENMKIKLIIDTTTFMVTFSDNATANAFKQLLPMTIDMSELNNNEKYYGLPQSLPTNASNPGTVQNGDLMLYGSNTLVLFYKTFSTSYSYTRIGRVDDPTGLQKALGAGSVTVTFEMQ